MGIFRRIFGRSHEEEAVQTEVVMDTEVSQSPASTAPLPDEAPPSSPSRSVPDGATRPLAADPTGFFQSHMGHIVFGQLSDPGIVRNNNQDAALSYFFTSDSVDDRPDFGLFVLADGMGGHHDGEKASALTTRTVAHQILTQIYLPLLENSENDADRPTISEVLSLSVKRANRDVMRDVPEGGTTLTALVVVGDLAHIAHVGDSRAYLISNGSIEQLTRDHSLVQRLIELNQLTIEESLEHPQRNVLYRAIGQTQDLEVDTLTRRLPPGSSVLLCSDGLWGLISEKDISAIVQSTIDPQEACEKLIALANAQGGHDNITAILLRVPQK